MILKFRTILYVNTLFSVYPISLPAQDISSTKNGIKKEIYLERSEACNPDLVYMILEVSPRYKDGISSLEKILNDAIFIDRKVKKEYFLRCTINCKGEIFGFVDTNSEQEPLQEEIQKTILKIQGWQAGMQNGETVDSFFVFHFKIKKGKLKIL